jgi:hypothetical protein
MPLPVFGLKTAGTRSATGRSVTRFRSALSMVGRLTALTLFATQLVATAAASHETCAAGKHDCGSTARIAACCCAGDTEASRKTGPVAPVVRVDPPAAVAGDLSHQLAAPEMRPLPMERPSVSRPPQDLLILLANLRV